jgi:hypothetical protein
MKAVGSVALCGLCAALLCAQQFKFDLGRLEAKASNTVDLSLDGSTLQFAAKFLDGKDSNEARVKKLIAGLDGIYIKSFEFKSDGAWSAADLESVRSQLRAPAWSRIVGVKSAEEGETAEVYVRTENKKVEGVAILASGPRELTVVNIVGPVDLDSLADLAGHLGLPKVEVQRK